MRRLGVIAAAALVVVALVVLQLVLPVIAAHRLRERLSHYGSVRSVSVSAFPAVELLWHHADRVDLQLGSYRSGGGTVAALLRDAGGVGTLDVSADAVDVGLLRVRGARLHKSGDALSAQATVAEADLRAAVPFLDGVVPVASSGGSLILRGTATVLGLSASADALVEAQNGALVVTPQVPFGSLATVTLFSDPHVAVQQVSAAPAAGGFTVSAQGQLH